ncbi:MAG: tellurite resistance TerB family protein [Methanomicrobiales archaeon]|jgi:uncharacterized tellurite resistance protein B-like protein|nr:tellurite resistance TerB family protein [Methanomicrobiales archaeon]
MGIFDKLRGSSPVALSPKSALVLSALTVIASDGVIDQAELADLDKIVRGDRKSVETAIQVLKAHGLEESMDLVAACLDEKQKLATMAILLDLSMADGVLAPNEQKILQMYMEKFGLTEATMKSIIEIIGMKNDFSIFQ